MSWHPSLDQLRDALAELYPHAADARRVARASGLSIEHVIVRDDPLDIWHSLVRDAEKKRRVGTLIWIASSEHPKSSALHAAASAYTRWVAMGRSSVSTSGACMAGPLVRLDLGGGLALELVQVAAGEFLMGRPESDPLAGDSSKPQHKLWLPAYLMGRYPVTVAQYRAFARATGQSDPPAPDGVRVADDHPITNVTWPEAMAFCAWASDVTKSAIRLPSEAEWEKAACWDKAGQRARIYPWGDRWSRLCNFGGSHRLDTTPVGHYSPLGDSPYGCADMAGNIWEWTSSLWGQDGQTCSFGYPYDPHDGRENSEGADDFLRIVRGGSYRDPMGCLRCTVRHRGYPYARHVNYGFRVMVPLHS